MNRLITVLKSAMFRNGMICFIALVLIFSSMRLLAVNVHAERQNPVDSHAIYKDYFYNHYQDNSCSVIFSDLTHDGNDEMIILQMLEEDSTPKNIRDPAVTAEDFKAAELIVLRAKPDNRISELSKTYIASQHSNWGQIYLYKDNANYNRAYLLNFNPYTMGGSSHYSYSLYYFSEKGKPVIFDENKVSFVAGEKDRAGSREKIMGFEQSVQEYIKVSKPLIVYAEDENGKTVFDYFNNAPESAFTE